MFIDRARVRVTGGNGGNGCVSFRREKYVPMGGPEGGDGGDGGHVYFRAAERLTSLLDIRYHSHWRGNRGTHGKGSACHGRNGEDIYVDVPMGTVVRDFETHELLADLKEPGDLFQAGRGGKGGKGNARFTSSTNQAPRFAELGEPGEEREYLIELKLIAEVGLVGLPNAGKSTFLSAVTAATPKVADYPFTTLSPNLGVAKLSDYRTLTIADIPGIIEGAAEGKGLGHDFLRHIERTKVLLFLIDLGDEDPLITRKVLEAELAQHSEVFAKRPRVYALNKSDIPENRARFDELKEHFPNSHLISGVTGDGVKPVIEELWKQVERVRSGEADATEDDDTREYKYEAPFTIKPTPSGFRVLGEKVARALRMTNFDNEEAIRHFQHKLKRMGVMKALERMGAEEGHAIFIEDMELEYHPD